MAVSNAQKIARNKHDKENFEYATLKMRKGRKSEIAAHAASKGLTLNAYVLGLIDADIKKEGEPT